MTETATTNTRIQTPVNRMYKARLFEMIFSDKKELLELYNAVSKTNYTDPELLEINTLYNPNLPLRYLMYVSDLYSGMTKDENLYGTKQLSIPTPRFLIFYNGIDPQPDMQMMKLSELYTIPQEHPALELEAVMLNINPGHNTELLDSCRTLKGYSEYTARVREYADRMPLEEAVEQAVAECIREGILAGFLSRNRAEAVKMSIYEYDEEKHMRQEREAEYERGLTDGISQGEQKKLLNLIQTKLKKGKAISQIAEELEESEAVIKELVKNSCCN